MDNVLLLLIASAAAIATFIVHVRLKQGPVRASALITLVISGLIYLFPHLLPPYLTKHIPAIVIGASFIGMVSSERVATSLGIGLAGLIFGLIYLNTSKYFDGYGGALGTSACISVLVVMSIPHLTSKRKLTVGVLQLRRLLFKKQDKKTDRTKS